jgi:riboflavin kinase/FMN adenylyltransferase
MQQFFDIEQAQMAGPSFLTIGNFDGLHRGHQALLQQMQTLAAATYEDAGGPRPQTGLLTFDPHPLAVLRPDQAQPLLTTPQERLTLADRLGIDFGVIQRFTLALAKLTPLDFLALLKRHLGMAALVVGPDFALGRNRSGDIQTLRQLGKQVGYDLYVVEPIIWHGEAQVRSSAIREALLHGDVRTAAEMLGRPYAVTGKVVTGDRRGRQLGIPTANLQTPPAKLLPANGVYATWTAVHLEDGVHIYPSVTNLGIRPTVDGQLRRLECHLLDFPRPGYSDDIYGRTLDLHFVAHLRGEQRFPDLDALVAQIHADIAEARRLLPLHTPPQPM